METNKIEYSVLMSVYCKEKPEWLELSIKSMLNQTVFPSEFVLVKDGRLTDELESVINKYIKEYSDLFNVITLEKNIGLGAALKIGVENCKKIWIARMDSDDYSIPTRIEKEFDFLEKNPNYDIIGSWHKEFIGNIDNVVTTKKLPETNAEIIKYSKMRNPFSHPSVLMRKDKVLNADNYRSYHLVEDYDMWVRMIRNGCKCYNIQESLIFVRVSEDLYKRRGGMKYLKSILKFKSEQFKIGYMSFSNFFISSFSSTVVCLIPSSLRKFVYEKLLRK